jgi:hypothetical protein
MRGIGTNRRLGSWLGLAALTLQLILSFGHIHLGSIRGGSTTALNTQLPTSPPSPVQHPTNEVDDYCAICATIHLASFLPHAPLLPVPFASGTIEHFGNFAFIFVSPQRAAFQSRAPPLA